MSERDWFLEYARDARRKGDEQRSKMATLHQDAYTLRETDPDRCLALLAEGRHLAKLLDEPWWVLYYDQYRVHALLHFKQDYREVLEAAVRNTLEVRKPAYAGYPRKLIIHDDLVSAYLGIDPVGYEGPIREALAYLDGEIPPEGDDRYMWLGASRQLALALNDLDTADEFVRRSMVLAGTDRDRDRAEHFSVFSLAARCEIAWKRGDLERLGDAATMGEGLARNVGHQVELGGFFLWQAVLGRHKGEQERAAQLCRIAKGKIARVRMPPDPSFFDALCAYHEQAGEIDQAAQARAQELDKIKDRGRHGYETRVRVALCKLLARLGKLTPADLAEARAAANRLRQPAASLAELDALEKGLSAGK